MYVGWGVEPGKEAGQDTGMLWLIAQVDKREPHILTPITKYRLPISNNNNHIKSIFNFKEINTILDGNLSNVQRFARWLSTGEGE